MVRFQVRFTGQVQGVGFRATTRHVASSFPVTGWVRNEPDGSVLLQAQGREDDVQAFLIELRTRMARFIRTEVPDRLAASSGEDGFRIAH
jgi:acylphosphatase